MTGYDDSLHDPEIPTYNQDSEHFHRFWEKKRHTSKLSLKFHWLIHYSTWLPTSNLVRLLTRAKRFERWRLQFQLIFSEYTQACWATNGFKRISTTIKLAQQLWEEKRNRTGKYRGTSLRNLIHAEYKPQSVSLEVVGSFWSAHLCRQHPALGSSQNTTLWLMTYIYQVGAVLEHCRAFSNITKQHRNVYTVKQYTDPAQN